MLSDTRHSQDGTEVAENTDMDCPSCMTFAINVTMNVSRA